MNNVENGSRMTGGVLATYSHILRSPAQLRFVQGQVDDVHSTPSRWLKLSTTKLV